MIEELIILTQIIFIDIILAADNAIIIGLIAANFVPKNRKQIILWGVIGALVFKVIFALFATYLFEFYFIKILEKDVLQVGAATLDRKVANYAKDNGLANLEFLSCIPGSIGGAIKMNSGCYNDDISKVLLSVQAIDLNKFSEVNIGRADIKFLYRGSSLPDDLIIVSAKLKCSISNKLEIE